MDPACHNPPARRTATGRPAPCAPSVPRGGEPGGRARPPHPPPGVASTPGGPKRGGGRGWGRRPPFRIPPAEQKAATAADPPPLEPPGDLSKSQGLFVRPVV